MMTKVLALLVVIVNGRYDYRWFYQSGDRRYAWIAIQGRGRLQPGE